MFDTDNIPELNKDEYRVFNRIRSALDFSTINVSYNLDSDVWRDQLEKSGTLNVESEQSIHCLSLITQSFSNEDFTFSVNANCGVYLSDTGLFSNDFTNPQYSLKIHNKNSKLIDLSGDLGSSSVGKSVLDLFYRNTTQAYPSEYDWKAMENAFRLELMKHFNVSPVDLMPKLTSIIRK